MTPSEADNLVGQLTAAYPNHQIDEQQLALWYRDVFAGLDPSTGLAAVQRWIKTQDWFPRISQFRDLAREIERDVPARRQLAAERCDGTGWIAGGMRPCPTCNPSTTRIFADPSLLASWRAGVPSHQILEMTRGDFRDEYDRVACKPPIPGWDGERPAENVVGRSAAAEAYVRACEVAGHEPDWNLFHRLVDTSDG